MTNYILDFKYRQSNSAGSKAKNDIIFFLKEAGFKSIYVPIYRNRVIRGILSKVMIKTAFRKISNDKVVFQYPLYHERISNYILNDLEKKNVKKIVVIHDLESLRLNLKEESAIAHEVSFLNRFDEVISHNDQMTKWLKDNGLVTEVTNLEIFDYDNPFEGSIKNKEDKISFAGNLVKSTFLEKLDVNTHFEVMGPNPTNNYPKNITYKGMFTPEEVPSELNGKYGLVWDGTSVNTCDGLYGHYMKYNNPHKTSLYLSTGIPVIIWKKAAIAKFIEENKLGLTIDNLSDIDQVLKNISENEYEIMRNNAQNIALKLKNGFYIKKAIK
ncbi:hypothetical protein [Pediococcus pentosaceus]|uniref:hypothetical protein n=1 Tax=Pediococcus pentosaceus TaxID=1255 RepID=UPI002017F335|nr:hypothetical protein [Pediococcus pentosaceus]MCL3858249.1 hypothetical protein [Pediococcus pentosaceus]